VAAAAQCHPDPEESKQHRDDTAAPGQAAAVSPAAAGASLTQPPPVASPPPGARVASRRRQRRRLRQAVKESRRRSGVVPRDPSWQWQQRQREYELRTEAVALVRASQEQGQSLPEVARRLELPPRTLRHWCQASRQGDWQAKALGRPHVRLQTGTAQEVVSYLHGHGPWLGVPALRVEFPTAARAELRDLLRLFRWLWAEAHPQQSHVLHWHRVGAVWAMDFTKVKQLLEGGYRHVFAVRDLASGMQLCWRAVPDLTRVTVQSELQVLFTIYGAPLLLKSDNGSAFRAEEQKQFLRRWSVWPLYSPPGEPGYNGAIEASIGSLKKRTEFLAYRQGRARCWTEADLEAARALANASVRPRGLRGRSPEAAWEDRRPPSRSAAEAFGRAVQQAEEAVRREEGISQGTVLEHYEQAALQRRVLTQLLVESGLLTITRRRIPQKFFGQKVANI
jgi:transposase InsO family protein